MSSNDNHYKNKFSATVIFPQKRFKESWHHLPRNLHTVSAYFDILYSFNFAKVLSLYSTRKYKPCQNKNIKSVPFSTFFIGAVPRLQPTRPVPLRKITHTAAAALFDKMSVTPSYIHRTISFHITPSEPCVSLIVRLS